MLLPCKLPPSVVDKGILIEYYFFDSVYSFSLSPVFGRSVAHYRIYMAQHRFYVFPSLAINNFSLSFLFLSVCGKSKKFIDNKNEVQAMQTLQRYGQQKIKARKNLLPLKLHVKVTKRTHMEGKPLQHLEKKLMENNEQIKDTSIPHDAVVLETHKDCSNYPRNIFSI